MLLGGEAFWPVLVKMASRRLGAPVRIARVIRAKPKKEEGIELTGLPFDSPVAVSRVPAQPAVCSRATA